MKSKSIHADDDPLDGGVADRAQFAAIARLPEDVALRHSLAAQGNADVRRQTFEQQTGRCIALAVEAFRRKRAA